LEIWNNEKYRHFRRKHLLREWMDIPICARCDSWSCRSKQVVRKGDLVVHQTPFYRHMTPVPLEADAPPAAVPFGLLDHMIDGAKATGGAIKRTLINLTTVRRKAS